MVGGVLQVGDADGVGRRRARHDAPVHPEEPGDDPDHDDERRVDGVPLRGPARGLLVGVEVLGADEGSHRGDRPRAAEIAAALHPFGIKIRASPPRPGGVRGMTTWGWHGLFRRRSLRLASPPAAALVSGGTTLPFTRGVHDGVLDLITRAGCVLTTAADPAVDAEAARRQAIVWQVDAAPSRA